MSRMLAPVLLVVAVLAWASPPVAQVTPEFRAAPPAPRVAADAVRFAVLGDNGSGDRAQLDIARQMVAFRDQYPYDLVLMVGDNVYTKTSPRVLEELFARPYKPLLDAGVRFQAVLGNHDDPVQTQYPPFNMDGQRYYTFARGGIRFFALDTNIFDGRQLQWFEAALKASDEPWKIAYFHHPLYSNGARHGSNVELRVRLEPLLVRYGVSVVFAGHDHLYERWKPQKGITHFVVGAGGKLRKGVRASDQSALAFDREQSFLIVEIAGDEFRFHAISRSGAVIDTGVIHLQPTT